MMRASKLFLREDYDNMPSVGFEEEESPYKEGKQSQWRKTACGPLNKKSGRVKRSDPWPRNASAGFSGLDDQSAESSLKAANDSFEKLLRHRWVLIEEAYQFLPKMDD